MEQKKSSEPDSPPDSLEITFVGKTPVLNLNFNETGVISVELTYEDVKQLRDQAAIALDIIVEFKLGAKEKTSPIGGR